MQRLINLRTGETHSFCGNDSISFNYFDGVPVSANINFSVNDCTGPWSVSTDGMLQAIFDGLMTTVTVGMYCDKFRLIPIRGGNDTYAKQLIGEVVAHRPMCSKDEIGLTQLEPACGLAVIYHDRPTITVDFPDRRATVNADECRVATKDQQIAYWRERALNACSLNEGS